MEEKVSVFSSPPKNRDRNYRPPQIAADLPRSSEPTWLDRLARRTVLQRMRDLQYGNLHIHEAAESFLLGTSDGADVAEVEILDSRIYQKIATCGTLGAGDGYVQGYWQSPDLLEVTRLFAKNISIGGNFQSRPSPTAWLQKKLLRWGQRNSRRGSRRNIQQHYDLSNEFFAQFLDPTMTYSAGIFESDDASLEAASLAKYRRVCDQLDLRPEDHVVEIGCGWGGFAEYAAENYGCRVTGITLSQKQLEFAQERIRRAGLQDRVTLRWCDYRDLEGSFDKLVSIEMIEAVGHEYLNTFFAKCSSLLPSTGKMLLQCITIPNQRYEAYRCNVDFIQKYIFPGGCLPSMNALNNSLSQVTDLYITSIEDFSEDYARTLKLWRQAFHRATDHIAALDFDAAFCRTWDYYFCYCAAGFLERQIGVVQILLAKPQASYNTSPNCSETLARCLQSGSGIGSS